MLLRKSIVHVPARVVAVGPLRLRRRSRCNVRAPHRRLARRDWRFGSRLSAALRRRKSICRRPIRTIRWSSTPRERGIGREGVYDVWCLSGGCSITQGAFNAHGKEAALWIEQTGRSEFSPQRLIVYLEGDVTIDYMGPPVAVIVDRRAAGHARAGGMPPGAPVRRCKASSRRSRPRHAARSAG